MYETKPYGEKAEPVYKLLTTEELLIEKEKAEKKAHVLLQIPPVLPPRAEIEKVLSTDTDLDGFDIHHSKYVFTDISLDTTDRV